MIMSLSSSDLLAYFQNQLSSFFPDNRGCFNEVCTYWNLILDRTEYCFSYNNGKYFRNEQGVIFNHLNADQYSMFLYFAAHTLYQNGGDPIICDKIFYLNRCLHGIDVYYEVELPDIFLFSHPLGTVLGRAKYSNYLLVFQNCNVGGSMSKEGKIEYPVLGEYVSLQTGSFILGNCKVGNLCTIAAGSLLLNQDLPNQSLYIGTPRSHTIKTLNKYPYEWGKCPKTSVLI